MTVFDVLGNATVPNFTKNKSVSICPDRPKLGGPPLVASSVLVLSVDCSIEGSKDFARKGDPVDQNNQRAQTLQPGLPNEIFTGLSAPSVVS